MSPHFFLEIYLHIFKVKLFFLYMKIITKKDRGNYAEKMACRYLKKHSYKIIKRNFACNTGEIDIIAYDKISSELVFIEVRYRKEGLESAICSVNYPKRKRIMRASRYFLMLNDKYSEEFLRYDIIAASHDENNKFIIEHIPDAFR